MSVISMRGDDQMRVKLTALEAHARQRQIVRSIVWRCEDSRVAVVTVTYVTDDLVEDDDGASVERLTVG